MRWRSSVLKFARDGDDFFERDIVPPAVFVLRVKLYPAGEVVDREDDHVAQPDAVFEQEVNALLLPVEIGGIDAFLVAQHRTNVGFGRC